MHTFLFMVYFRNGLLHCACGSLNSNYIFKTNSVPNRFRGTVALPRSVSYSWPEASNPQSKECLYNFRYSLAKGNNFRKSLTVFPRTLHQPWCKNLPPAFYHAVSTLESSQNSTIKSSIGNTMQRWVRASRPRPMIQKISSALCKTVKFLSHTSA